MQNRVRIVNSSIFDFFLFSLAAVILDKEVEAKILRNRGQFCSV